MIVIKEPLRHVPVGLYTLNGAQFFVNPLVDCIVVRQFAGLGMRLVSVPQRQKV